MEILFDLLANAKIQDNTYCADKENKLCPLVQILKERDFKGQYLVLAPASYGKSTSLLSLRLNLIEEKAKTFVYYDLFSFINADKNIEQELKAAVGLSVGSIAILDSYDEVSAKNRSKTDEIIGKIMRDRRFDCVIVASRFNPANETNDLGRNSLDFWDKFSQIELTPLEEDRISALADYCHINHNFVFSLLNIPMYAVMALELKEDNESENIFDAIEDEASYIEIYLKKLLQRKEAKNINTQFEFDQWSLFERAYESIKEGRCNEKIEIPSAFNSIFREEFTQNGTQLRSSSIRFINYAAAKYVVNWLAQCANFRAVNCENIDQFLEFPLESDNLEMLKFAGELLRHHNNGDKILALLNSDELKRDCDSYFNVCLLTFGYSQEINDERFALGDCFAKIFSKRIGEKTKQIMSSSIPESKYYWFLFPVERALKENSSIYILTEEVHGVLFFGNKQNPREVIVDSKENITNVIITPETKAITSGAFAHCMVKHIFISNSLEYIGQYAFYECLWLESVEFEKNSLCSFIGNGAFYCCISLKNIEIPEKIKCISEGTFEFSGLENVKIPQSVISIDSSAFSATNLKSIDIPNGVVSIGSEAFSVCDSLESVSISESVISIGREAFFRCNNLQSIVIPISVNNIESGAFANCPAKIIITEGNENFTEIDGVIYNKSMTRIVYVSPSVKEMLIPKTITDIAHVFAHNNAIKNVRFEEGTKIISVGSNAFERCENLNSIKLPNSITTIDSFAFSECKNLMNIKIPASVMNIVDSAFTNCPAWLTVEEGNESFVEDKGVIYNKVKTKIIYISAGVEEILIPKTVTDIAYVFGHNKNIKSISFEEGSTLNNIPFYAFNSCENLSSLKLPNGITAIDRGAFCGCTSLTDLEVPASVTSIHAEAFKNCSAKVTIDARNKNFIIIDGVIYDKFLTKVISGSDSSEEIVIPKTVTDISFAFSQNYKLKNVCFEENSAITSVGDSAFLRCTSLTNIKLPDSVISIGPDAFCGCTGLENIKISSNVTNICAYAFSGCTGLTSITIPESVTDIGEYAFLKCSNLINIKLPSSLTSIGFNAFCDCSSLKNIEIPGGVNNIANYLFKNCVALESIVIPGCVTSIKLSAIDNCPNLKAIYYKGKRKRSESDSKKIGSTIVYYFSEEQPAIAGDYWHYVNGIPTIW